MTLRTEAVPHSATRRGRARAKPRWAARPRDQTDVVSKHPLQRLLGELLQRPVEFTQYLAALHRPPRRRRIALSVGSCADVYGDVFAESVIGLFKTAVIQRKGPCRRAI
jgi:hypothetical protein